MQLHKSTAASALRVSKGSAASKVITSRPSVVRHAVVSPGGFHPSKNSELDALGHLSSVVPEGVLSTSKANAAAVSYGLLRSIASSESLGLKPLENAIVAARAYSSNVDKQVDKAMVNVGAILAEKVTGRITTEVDPRLANNAEAMVAKCQSLAALYKEVKVPASRLLFRIPATWAGIQAARTLESHGLNVHLCMVYSFVQGVAGAQAGCSLINPNVGRVREWYNKHPGVIRDPHGPRQDAGLYSPIDPGVELVKKLYNYIKIHHPTCRIMASGIRSREDALALAGCDFLLLPDKVMLDLDKTPTMMGYNNDMFANSSSRDEEEVMQASLTYKDAVKAAVNKVSTVGEETFMESLGMAGKDLLSASLHSALKDVEALGSLAKATTGRSST